MMALVYLAFAAFFVDVALCQLPTYRNIEMDDVVFQHSLLFDQPVRSLLECATRCSKDDNCVTFTRVVQPSGDVSCRGHSAEMDSASPMTSLELAKAKTFVMTDTQGKMDADECASSPCQNGGTCTDLVNSYTCTCTPKYSGNQCQTEIDPCDPESYTTLENPERSTTYTGVVNLGDNNLTAGWFRFKLSGQNVMIARTCTNKYRCGSSIPLWVDEGGQSAPGLGKEVNVTVCGGDACSCTVSKPVIIRNCFPIFVYYLVPIENVDAQYCAEPFP